MSASQAIAVARVEDIPPGHAARVQIDGVPVAVFNVDGTYYAVDDTCTHAEASLSEGELDPEARSIEGPLHGSCFDLGTGEPLSLPAVEPIGVHDVSVDDGVIMVALGDG